MNANSSELVLVAGAGVVGASTALALAKLGFSVILVEPKPATSFLRQGDKLDSRVYALNAGTKVFLSTLGVWQALLTTRICPYSAMQVWDAESFGNICFEAKKYDLTELGFIVEEQNLIQALDQRLAEEPNVQILRGVSVQTLLLKERSVEVGLSSEETVLADLVISADGARSSIRESIGFKTIGHDYEQLALVAQLITDRKHKTIALQRFCGTSTIALLPLCQEQSYSLVWSMPKAQALETMALGELAIAKAIQELIQGASGNILAVEQLQSFPLEYYISQEFVKERVVLLGDVAHRTHPHAGLGLNLGLKGVALLSKKLSEGLSKETLSAFEREQKGSLWPVLKGIDSLHYLFKNQNPLVKWARNVGLNFVDRHEGLKKHFLEIARG